MKVCFAILRQREKQETKERTRKTLRKKKV